MKPETIEKILPTVLIVIDLLAAAVYLGYGKWWHVIYWLAAGLLTTAVTYGMK